MIKPRVRFCWECGKQLRGNHHVEREIEGHVRVLHKMCAKLIEAGIRMEDDTYNESMRSETWGVGE